MRPCILLLSLFLIAIAAPVQGQEPGQKARGWHSIDQNTPRLFEGILNADLDLETEDGLVISKEDLRDRIYFDAEEQQTATGIAMLGSGLLGLGAVLVADLAVTEVGCGVMEFLVEEHNKHYFSDCEGVPIKDYAITGGGMALLGGILSKLFRGVWKDW